MAGMFCGSLIAGPCANLIGRKYASLFGTCGSLALGYSLFSGAQYVWMMHMGRFFQGAGLGFSTTISTIYIMEVITLCDFKSKHLVKGSQCGNFRILLSFRFYVKSTLENFKVLKVSFLPFFELSILLIW